MSARILIFSPYAARYHVLAYEGTIARACQLRGAQVEFLLCDGLLPECDMHWDSHPGNVTQRPLHICTSCQSRVRRNFGFAEFQLPFTWLGQYLSEPERAEIYAWAQQLRPEEMAQAQFRGLSIGEWVLSSVVTYFRQYPPDLRNWRVASVYRGFLYSGAMVAVGLNNYLDAVPVDAALQYNGRQSLTRVAFEVLRRRGIRELTHEYPFFLRGHLMVKANARCWTNEPFLEFWRDWWDVPLTGEALAQCLRWLRRRRYGSGLPWHAFNRPYVEPVAIHRELGLDPRKKLMALFTSSTDETAGDPELIGPFPSQAAWVEDVLAWIATRDDVQLIVRVHPHLAGNTGLGRATDEYGYYQRLKDSRPRNARIVMPDDVLNSYALMDAADVCLSYGSSVGLEMAMLGKPVVLASRGVYEDGAHVVKVGDRATLTSALEQSLRPAPAREIRRDGFRLAWYYVFRFERPFPLVAMHGIMDARLTYQGPEALAPGKDEVLDRICGYLISNQPLFASPSAADRARTTAEEDAFFDQLESSPAPFADPAYERLLRFTAAAGALDASLRRLPLGLGRVSAKAARLLSAPIQRLLESRA